MEGNEVPSLGSLEQAQRVRRGEVAFPKARLPPGSVTDGQQGDVELAAGISDVLVDDPVGMLRERRVPGEEHGVLIRELQLHIGRGAPAIDPISAAIVLGRCSTNRQPADGSVFVRRKRLSMHVASPCQPARHGWRAEERNVPWQGIEARKGQMICMRMRQQQCINAWKIADRNTWRTDSREKSTEPPTKVRIRENPHATELQQQRCVSYVGDAQRERDLARL